ncbi:MAG: hypothetical protein J2P54_14180 [Bradyrhizobiaceae bacterium]|nr:hypothetical protein [Bradyrhizobiaceae bacterium]
MELLLLIWLPFCIAVGMFASIRRNRSGIGWFLFAFFLSPLLGIIFVAILRERPLDARQRQALVAYKEGSLASKLRGGE